MPSRPDRTGRLFGGSDQHIIPADAMALSWASDKPVWYLINDRLDTLIDEYEEETLSPQQAIAAADLLRASLIGIADPSAQMLRAAADFIEWHGGAGDTVRIAL